MSTSVNSAAISVDASVDAPDGPSEPLDDTLTRPVRKKRKVAGEKPATTNQQHTKPSRIRKKGKLAALPEMPLYVLYEIFSNMHPLDLLHVSRTTKMLRSVLMSRSSAWIWKESCARAIPALPPVPADLDIPQFVRLAYDRTCHYCGASGARIVKCLVKDNLFIEEFATWHRFPSFKNWNYQIGQFIPRVRTGLTRRSRYRYPKPSIDAFAAAFAADGVGEMDEDQERAWLDPRAKQFAALAQHASICEEWDEERQSDRSWELQAIRDERKKNILQRLTELGWAEEVEKSRDKLCAHKLVHKAQPLSEKVGNNVKDTLLAHITELQTKRIAEEKEDAILNRCQALAKAYSEFLHTKPFTAILPTVGDIYTLHEFANLIEVTHYEEEIPQATYRALLDAPPDSYFESWRENCDAALVNVLNSIPREGSPATRADLRLATTAFVTPNGHFSPLTQGYPHILASDRMTDGQICDDRRQMTLRQRPWTATGLRVAVRHRARAEAVVALAGLDPKTATSDEMDALDPWFLCPSERRGYLLSSSRTRAVNWRGACSCDEESGNAAIPAFELLGTEDTERVRARSLLSIDRWARSLQCAHCELRMRMMKGLKDHLLEMHSIDCITQADYMKGPSEPVSSALFEWPLQNGSDEENREDALFDEYGFW
ncbi:hypothetical protein K523DRAFT_376815 [Schizophyllum commune Tattone D]|nr:hypothetical protein K523DRAFT_376815 [Schizophyllum commune Tattone D]